MKFLLFFCKNNPFVVNYFDSTNRLIDLQRFFVNFGLA
ncbi:hypothetical protein FM107_08180 [Sphingobacterium sp. JB170]|nr:hypothetical protein FM107_08180 [Sphingobacterium sp. JB170]